MPAHYCAAGRHYAGECAADEPITFWSVPGREPVQACHFAMYPNPGYASCPEHAHLTPEHFFIERLAANDGKEIARVLRPFPIEERRRVRRAIKAYRAAV
jgi:hypothetical protein